LEVKLFRSYTWEITIFKYVVGELYLILLYFNRNYKG